MPTMFQVRNLPDSLHRKLRIRAAEEGLSMSDYVIRVLEAEVGQPSLEDVLARLAELPPVRLTVDPVDLIRERRDAE